jgi:hypothetical protein
MAKFYATLTRESFVELKIEADDYDDAEMKLQDLIDNTDFRDICVTDYPLIDIIRAEDENVEIDIIEVE